MLPSSIRNHLLVDEGQLGQRLNSDLHHGDRADFRLYLALLTAAVEEQPWFDAKPAASLGSRDWRLHFDLRQAEVLVAEGAGSDCSAINERLQQGGGEAWWMRGFDRRCNCRRWCGSACKESWPIYHGRKIR